MIKKCSGYVRQAAVATAGVNSNPGRPCRSSMISLYLQGSTSIFILLRAMSSEFDFFPFSFFFFLSFLFIYFRLKLYTRRDLFK